MSSKNVHCFASGKNIYKQAIVWFKITAECKEDALLKGAAIQHAYEKAIHFIQYLYLDNNRPEARKRQKKCANLCEVRPKEGVIKGFSDVRFTTTVKT